MRVKLMVAYDGTDYAGWQRQSQTSPDPRPTIQATVEEALGRILNTDIKVVASGRTDAGVHAEAQILHFNTAKDLTGLNLLRGLNAITPNSLGFLKAWQAPEDFHSLFSATHKTYRYLIYNSPTPDPLQTRYSYWMTAPLNLMRLNALTEPLLGEHDFKSFQTSGTEVKTTTRSLMEAHWSQISKRQIELRITGTGFLKQMVRNIVGTILYLHQNEGSPIDTKQILQGLDRQLAKGTAAPQGLYLHKVYYPPELDNGCREL